MEDREEVIRSINHSKGDRKRRGPYVGVTFLGNRNIIFKKIIKLTLILTPLSIVNAYACMNSYRPTSELKEEATVVVLATVISTKIASTSFRGNVVEYEIDMVSFEKGNIDKNLTKATYEDTVAHRRGELTVCPLKNGSGIEHNLEINLRYRFFLRSEKDPEILLVESEDK